LVQRKSQKKKKSNGQGKGQGFDKTFSRLGKKTKVHSFKKGIRGKVVSTEAGGPHRKGRKKGVMSKEKGGKYRN